MSEANNNAHKPSVLIVDDEVNILRSIRRTLHKMDIELLIADAPEKALEILSKRKVDVVLSDMKMPNMNGAQLLAKVAEQQPNSFRIILSGYADVESMLAAINHGKVHRYLNKPWGNEELLGVIQDGIELSQLRMENARLLELTQQQNQKLADNNKELEKTVSMRTRQIRSALTRIQRHSSGLERAFYNVIVSHPNIDGKFARQVSESAEQLAKTLNLTKKEQMVVRFAGLICEIGLVGLSIDLLEKPFSLLNYEQKKAYVNQAGIAQLILAPLQGLDEEMDTIACQFELVNSENMPPTGARIISICRDYWRYRMGRILPNSLSARETQVEMLKHAGVQYDMSMLETFFCLDNYTLEQISGGVMNSDSLKPDMELRKDLYNNSHILLLPAGHVFTEISIAKLKKFERGYGTKLTLDIKPLKQADTIEVAS